MRETFRSIASLPMPRLAIGCAPMTTVGPPGWGCKHRVCVPRCDRRAIPSACRTSLLHYARRNHNGLLGYGEPRTATSTFTQLLSRLDLHLLLMSLYVDVVEFNVLGCRVDILGTNCDQCVRIRLIRTGSPGRPPRLSHSS